MHGEVLTSTLQGTATFLEAVCLCIFPSEQCRSVSIEHLVVPCRDCAAKSWHIKHFAHFLLSGWHHLPFCPAHSGLTPFPTSMGCLILATQSESLSQNLLNPQVNSHHKPELDPSSGSPKYPGSRKIKPSRGSRPPGRTSPHLCSAIKDLEHQGNGLLALLSRGPLAFLLP